MTRERTTPASFLGTGWSFPPTFTNGGAEVVLVSDAEDVHQSLQMLLSTRSGERPMQETYGCNLDELMFSTIDHNLVGRLRALVGDAVRRHEPRVDLLDVDVDQDRSDPALLHIRLAYLVAGTNSRYNMVFPFYLNEANVGI
jgi:phage baseplate assembly protein W